MSISKPLGAGLIAGCIALSFASASPAPVAAADPSAPVPRGPDARLVLRVPVLMYHLVELSSVVPRAIPDLVVSPSTFETQIKALYRAGWKTITAAQLAEYLATGTRPPARSMVITFDDGTVNGYTNAFRILKRYGYTATFYLIVGRIGVSPVYLTWPQVAEMLAAGMDVGNHTIGHPALSSLSGSSLAWQIVRAQQIVKSQVGYSMTTIAYPSGNYDAEVFAAAEKAGLRMGFTTRTGAKETWAGRFECPRVRVSPGTGGAGLVATLSRYD